MKNSEERILNAFLDEMLGDSRPSRSVEEILRNIKCKLATVENSNGETTPFPGDSVKESVTAPLVTTPAAVTTHSETTGQALASSGVPTGHSYSANPSAARPASMQRATKGKSSRFSVANLAAIVALVLAGGFLSYLLIDRLTTTPEIVVNDGDELNKQDEKDNGDKDKNRSRLNPTQDDRLANNPNRRQDPIPRESQPVVPNTNEKQVPPQMAVRDDVPEDQNKLILPPKFQRTRKVSVAAVDSQGMASEINAALLASWNSSGVEPAKPLELRNWANRLANRLIGRTLSATEMQAVNGFLVQAKPAEQIRRDLIDHMIETPAFRQEFNEYWGKTLAWELLGITQSMAADDVDMVQTREFIASKIAEDQPLDEVAYQLLSAVGSTDSASEKYNPASSYFVALTKRFGKRQPAVGHVAQSFLGQSVQCAQCHDGFGKDGQQMAGVSPTQKEFYEFRSFFAQLIFQPEENKDSFYLVNRNFLPLGEQGQVEAAFKYTDLQGNQLDAYPQLGQLKLGGNGFVEKVDRRSQLANHIANSNEFSETLVDHVWINLLNIPIDGLEGNADPSLANMRTELAMQLASNQFQLTWLVKAIAESEAFAVGVGTDEQLAASNPFLGASPRFDQFYHRIDNRRSAIQSLVIVANAYRSGDAKPALSAGLMARVDSTASQSQPNTILPFVPSKTSEWATSKSVSTQLDMIAASTMSDEAKVQHVVLAAVGREPYADELKQALAIIGTAENKRAAIQDVWWCLVNSVEFRLPRTASGGIR